jgi:hypothetical protein
VARQKWLECELARQATRADAALGQVAGLTQQREELLGQIEAMQVGGGLGQIQTPACWCVPY